MAMFTKLDLIGAGGGISTGVEEVEMIEDGIAWVRC
jgi:hypothetical protein